MISVRGCDITYDQCRSVLEVVILSPVLTMRDSSRPSDQSGLVTSQRRRQQTFVKLANNPLFDEHCSKSPQLSKYPLCKRFFPFLGLRGACVQVWWKYISFGSELSYLEVRIISYEGK